MLFQDKLREEALNLKKQEEEIRRRQEEIAKELLGVSQKKIIHEGL